MIFDKELYWARRRNKSEVTLKSGRKVLIDKPLRGQGDEVRRGKLEATIGGNRASGRGKVVNRDYTRKGYRFGNQIVKSTPFKLRLANIKRREFGERERISKKLEEVMV